MYFLFLLNSSILETHFCLHVNCKYYHEDKIVNKKHATYRNCLATYLICNHILIGVPL